MPLFKRCEFNGTPLRIPGTLPMFEECIFNVIDGDFIPPAWLCVGCVVDRNNGEEVVFYGLSLN